MKALDIVQLDNGSTGIVKEGNTNGCSIRWFGGAENKTAWWREGEDGLKVIDSLPSMLCELIRHPFSSDKTNPFN